MRVLKDLKIICLFVLLVWQLALVGQPKVVEDFYTKFRNLTSFEGLSHNQILDIKQDEYGFIWIATANGLNRFDGYDFKHFFNVENDSLSLPGDFVTSISFAFDGKMWVGTKSGLASYNPSQENFTRFPLHSRSQSGLSDAMVKKTLADKEQPYLWVETQDGVLNKIDLSDNSLQHHIHESGHRTNYDYHSLYRDREGKLWLGGRDFGPMYCDETNFTFHRLPVDSHDATHKRDKDLACVYQDEDKHLWMSATDGFYQYFPRSNTFKKHLGTSTYDILSASDTSLWLATASGLMIYDKRGDQFTLFKHQSNNDYSLVSNHVNVLFVDNNSNLWVGTSKGLSVLYYNKNLFTHYRAIPEVKESMPHDYVRAFLPYSDDKLWIGTHGGGVVEWGEQDNTFRTVEGTEGHRVSTMLKDKDDNVWIGMWSGLGFLKHSKAGKVTHYAYDENSFKRDWYNDFFEDASGRLWTGIWGAWGVHFFNKQKAAFEPYTLRLPEAHTRHLLDKIALQDDKLWLHWSSCVLHRYDADGAFFEGYSQFDTTEIVLPQWQDSHHYHYDDKIDFTVVHQLYADAKNGLSYWATNSGLLSFDKGRFQKLYADRYDEVFSIDRLGDEEHVLCTEKGVFRVATDTKRHSALGVNDSVSYKTIFALNDSIVLLLSEREVAFYDYNNNQSVEVDLSQDERDVLLGTNAVLLGDNTIICTDKGLVVLSHDFGKYTLYDMNNSFDKGLVSEQISGIVKYSSSLYYLATGKGLIAFDSEYMSFTIVDGTFNVPINGITVLDNMLWMPSDLGLISYDVGRDIIDIKSNMNNHKLSSHLISFIEQDEVGNMWVGSTNNGVNLFDTINYSIHQFLPNKDNANSFWGADASDLAVSPRGVVYISSDEGINIFNYSDSSFAHLTKAEGLPSNEVLGIEFDEEGYLWLVTPHGLAVYSPYDRRVRVFDDEWGLKSYQLSGDLYFCNKRMLIPSDHGFYSFNPSLLRHQFSFNQPGITGVKVFADEKKCDFLATNSLSLNYDENFFTISFSDFSFSETSTDYFYQLKGIDPDWVSTSSNYASYTNIKHGLYEFWLTSDENRSADILPVKLMVYIVPPFWKQTWFILLEVLSVCLIIFLLYKQKIRRYELRERTLQVEQKLLRSQMNPHFVFNALIAIQSFIFQSDAKEAGRYLSKFAKLMRLFLQNTRHDFILLSQELETLEHYMDLQRLRFDDNFTFSIVCDDGIQSDEVMLPPMMSQPFIENAIEHGFKSISYKGKILISYKIMDGSLVITISDNGVGVSSVLESQKHNSLATVITRERLLSMKTKSKNYSLMVRDLGEGDDANTGTEVVLHVPYKNAYKID